MCKFLRGANDTLCRKCTKAYTSSTIRKDKYLTVGTYEACRPVFTPSSITDLNCDQ
jgi:hypothetical protein